MILTTHAYARAGLIGNPSDGYFGKTISLILKNFRATVVLYESPELVIEPSERDIGRFASLPALVDDVQRHGYYGGIRLIKAAIKRFADYCAEQGMALPERNFTIRYHSDIPRLVGMGGSSAIVTAAFRALMAFYEVTIDPAIQANLILDAENDELGIPAGLQDRVIQVYEGLVYMDFERERMARQGYGLYEPIDPALLPPLYVAYDPDRSETSDKVHSQLRGLFEKGDPQVVQGMASFADLAAETRELLLAGRGADIGALMDRNYDLRATLNPISEENQRMIAAARGAGASAKFAGSGGAIIGTYKDEPGFEKLVQALSDIGCQVIKPESA